LEGLVFCKDQANKFTVRPLFYGSMVGPTISAQNQIARFYKKVFTAALLHRTR
jgi:hypothetical protein